MAPRGVLCLLLFLLWWFGSAQAGSADDPEITDPAGDTDIPQVPGGDILAAWIEDASLDGFTTVIRLASLDAVADRLTDHYFSFRLGGGHWCTYAYALPGGGFETAACGYRASNGLQNGTSRETPGNVTGTAPAEIRVHFPLDLTQNAASDGYELTGLVVETFDFKRADGERAIWPATRDHASSDATLQVLPERMAPETVPDPEQRDERTSPTSASPAILFLTFVCVWWIRRPPSFGP